LAGRLLALPRRLGRRCVGGAEHARRALEERHVLPRHVLELRHREEPAEGILDVAADLLLVAREVLHRDLEVARQERVELVVVEADELAQEADRQQVPALAVLLQDDLGEDRAGDVLAGLGVVDDEVLAAAHHLAQLVEGDVAAGGRVVEPPVRVLLDDRHVAARAVRLARRRLLLIRAHLARAHRRHRSAPRAAASGPRGR
jgi:hypothetical protein